MPAIQEWAESPSDQQEKKTDIIPLGNHDNDIFYDCPEYLPEELERLIAETETLKRKANQLFAEGSYDDALLQYDAALTTCPYSSAHLRATLYCNKGACYFKKEQYIEARDQCTEALALDPTYMNARSRKARANEKVGSSAALSDALKDYETLLQQGALPPAVKEDCDRAKRELPGAIQKKMDQEKEEMMGKLKDMGNMLLGKFNLSTDNFVFEKDPNTGSYNMNFVNQPSRST